MLCCRAFHHISKFRSIHAYDARERHFNGCSGVSISYGDTNHSSDALHICILIDLQSTGILAICSSENPLP